MGSFIAVEVNYVTRTQKRSSFAQTVRHMPNGSKLVSSIQKPFYSPTTDERLSQVFGNQWLCHAHESVMTMGDRAEIKTIAGWKAKRIQGPPDLGHKLSRRREQWFFKTI